MKLSMERMNTHFDKDTSRQETLHTCTSWTNTPHPNIEYKAQINQKSLFALNGLILA